MAETTTKSGASAKNAAEPGSETSRPLDASSAGKAARSSTTGKKAVIATGGKQYIVSVGEELEVELLDPAQQKTSFEAMLVIDGEKTIVGAPNISGAKVAADIIEQVVKQDKVVAIRYKAKKRVHKRRGHRQKLTRIKITKIESGE